MPSETASRQARPRDAVPLGDRAGVAQLPILTFHAIDAGDSPIAFAPPLFAAWLRLVAEHGYRVLSLREVRGCLVAGNGFPARALGVTFDDGYRSVFTEAYPRLRELGLPATLFLTVGETPRADGRERFPPRCGREMLNWDEVAVLAGAGWEIGAHGLGHADLSRIPLEQAKREVSESRRRIEERLGTRVTAFAYPYGRSSAAVRAWLAGELECACGVALGLASTKSDVLALERLDMYYLRSRPLLPLLFSPWLAPYLRLRRVPRGLRAWLRERLGR